MDTVSKICRRCNTLKPISDFYERKGTSSHVSECKPCMKERSKTVSKSNKDYLVPRAATEVLAIKYLHSKGIPALPGKAIRHSHVDVVAFGCVDIEVKYSKLDYHNGILQFVFVSTPAQQKDGYRARLVMLICDHGDKITHHIFSATDPVLYINGRVKNGMTFTPGLMEAKKHGNNRIVMVQPMMDEAQDNIALIYDKLRSIAQELKGA